MLFAAATFKSFETKAPSTQNLGRRTTNIARIIPLPEHRRRLNHAFEIAKKGFADTDRLPLLLGILQELDAWVHIFLLRGLNSLSNFSS